MLIWLTHDPFKGLLLSHMALSVPLPVTMVALVSLTSPVKVMGPCANSPATRVLRMLLTAIVTLLSIMLLINVGILQR